MSKVTLLGAGSWGSALARILATNGHEVKVWSIIEKEIQMLNLNYEHLDKLPGVKLPRNIQFTTDLAFAIDNAEYIVFATPSSFIRKTAQSIKHLLSEQAVLICVAKGIEDGSYQTMSQIIETEIPGHPVVALSGPSHAEEVGKDLPTTIVAACEKNEMSKKVQDLFMTENFRVYTSQDILGVELGGAIKNVIALAAGITDGLGFGDNTKAALMTRGMAEIIRLGVAMGANINTFNGLTGMGDLIVTCTSMHSRNRRAGMLIGQGLTLEEALIEVKMVVEGVYSAKAAKELSHRYQVEMPIIEQVNAVLFDGKSPQEAVDELMNRKKKAEY